jgi:hypothetical protein
MSGYAGSLTMLSSNVLMLKQKQRIYSRRRSTFKIGAQVYNGIFLSSSGRINKISSYSTLQRRMIGVSD